MPDSALILVIDDDPVQRDMTRLALTSVGWEAATLDRGDYAVAVLAARHHALVLLDIEMPGLDGFAVARAIRASGGTAASVPILAYTSLGHAAIAARIDAAGMDGHVAKPCAPDELVTRLAPWVAPPRTGWELQARLERMIGEVEYGGLLNGLAAQLREALATIDRPGCAARAHRVAGIAGTLGFADVSAAWARLAEGDGSARIAARVTARRALRAIQRRAASAG